MDACISLAKPLDRKATELLNVSTANTYGYHGYQGSHHVYDTHQATQENSNIADYSKFVSSRELLRLIPLKYI